MDSHDLSQQRRSDGGFSAGAAQTAVAMTDTAQLAGEMFGSALASGELANLDYNDANDFATCASLNPYAAFIGAFGFEFPGDNVSPEGTREFFLRRYVTERERRIRADALGQTRARVAQREGANLVRYARSMGVDFEEARAAAVLGDGSFFHQAEENLVFA